MASMTVALSDLPSRSLLPRPRELAEQLVPVAKEFGATTCSIAVWFDDPEADPERDGEACQVGTFRYDGGSWSTVEEDGPC